MAKIYESEDTVVYKNDDGDLWIKDIEDDTRTYVPHGSDKAAGVFNGHEQIDNDYDEDDWDN